MEAGSEIRKQVYELTVADLERHPVWEFAIDEEGEPGQDEATVKPRPDLRHADPSEGIFVVRAEFVARDASRFTGFVTPSEESDDLGSVQPTIVTPNGHVTFWFGIAEPSAEEIEERYRQLDKSGSELFPLRYTSDVAAGAASEGEIRAFLYLADDGETVKRAG